MLAIEAIRERGGYLLFNTSSNLSAKIASHTFPVFLCKACLIIDINTDERKNIIRRKVLEQSFSLLFLFFEFQNGP